MGARKKPVFGSRDQEKIKKKQENGGLSENTKARRRGVNKVFDECQKVAGRPTLKELCEARDKDGLDNDLQGFFEAYYVQIGTEDIDDKEENDDEPASGDKDQESENDDEDENDDKSESGDKDQESENEDEIDDESDSVVDEKDEVELTQDENEVKLRPKGNTSLSYKSHIKMLIKEFTSNEFDISDKVQFPNFNVSKYVKYKSIVHVIFDMLKLLLNFESLLFFKHLVATLQIWLNKSIFLRLTFSFFD